MTETDMGNGKDQDKVMDGMDKGLKVEEDLRVQAQCTKDLDQIIWRVGHTQWVDQVKDQEWACLNKEIK